MANNNYDIFPAINYRLFLNNKDIFDVRFELLNIKEIPVAVRVKVECVINAEVVQSPWYSYNGSDYWNLNPKQRVEGHFNLAKILESSKVFDNVEFGKELTRVEKIEKITKEVVWRNDLSKPPIIKLFLTVVASNEFGGEYRPLPTEYSYDVERGCLVPELTSNRVYWEQK